MSSRTDGFGGPGDPGGPDRPADPAGAGEAGPPPGLAVPGEAGSAPAALYAGDRGRLPFGVREVLVRLLRGPYLDRGRERLWESLVVHREAVGAWLSEIFLELVLDPDEGVAFVRHPPDGALPEGAPRLLRPVGLKFFEAVALIELRRRLNMAERQGERAVVAGREIRDLLEIHGNPDSTDRTTPETRFNSVMRRFEAEYKILSKLKGSEDRFEISPVIRHVASAEFVARVKDELESLRPPRPAGAPEAPAAPEERILGGEDLVRVFGGDDIEIVWGEAAGSVPSPGGLGAAAPPGDPPGDPPDDPTGRSPEGPGGPPGRDGLGAGGQFDDQFVDRFDDRLDDQEGPDDPPDDLDDDPGDDSDDDPGDDPDDDPGDDPGDDPDDDPDGDRGGD